MNTEAVTSHIYTARSQPATCYVVDCGGTLGSKTFAQPPRSLLECWRCKRKRWAAHCVVQVYYDCLKIYCAPGHGCARKKP
jgi:hypothetical protein